MDYLRTLGSAAVSSIVQKSGLTLPFSLGSKVSISEPVVWSLFDATKRDDGSPVSVFMYDFTDDKRNVPIAKNALRKLRTTRHPDVLKFIDAVETDSFIYVMTERVRPLPTVLQEWSSKTAAERDEYLVWGLHRVTVAITFINENAMSTHGNLKPSSIFVSASGEWKLGGFELLSNPKDDAAVLYTYSGLLADSAPLSPPEVKKSSWSALKENPVFAADAYAIGLLLHTIFNPGQALPPTTQPPHPPPQASSRGNIPTSIFPSFRKLLNPSPKSRVSPKLFLDIGLAQTAGEGSGFFSDNHLVKVCAGLDNFNLASEADKNALLRNLEKSASSFPPEFASYRVLPTLVSALEFGGASAVTILPLVLQLGKNTPPEDYPTAVLAPLIKLFASPDRGIRMALLDNLSQYADKLDKKAVSDKIWPHLQTGFSDTVAVIREATVKAIILLAPMFNDRILNNDLLRHLAKMQADPEASIRTNTCILIGRLGPTLGYNTKRKVLVPAFSKALKDPFVHARVAALMAFMATIDCFDVEDLARQVIPNMSFALVDKEKLVRDQAFKALDLFVKKVEQHAATMPEMVASPEANGPPGVPAPILSTSSAAALATTAGGAAGALAGWAFSSLSKTLASSDMATTMSSSATSIDRPTSAPPPAQNELGSGPALSSHLGSSPLKLNQTLSAANTALPSPAVSSFVGASNTSRAKGMQLGANKVPPSVLAAKLAEEIITADPQTEENPWGTDDLIDINADQDDWSAFETAPPAPAVEEEEEEADPWGEADNTPTGFSASPLSTQRTTPTAKKPPRQTTTTLAPKPTAPVRPVSPVAPNTPTQPSMAGMSKEEKAAEMQRRKEERKQRIAALKEKKAAGAKQ